MRLGYRPQPRRSPGPARPSDARPEPETEDQADLHANEVPISPLLTILQAGIEGKPRPRDPFPSARRGASTGTPVVAAFDRAAASCRLGQLMAGNEKWQT